MLQRLSVGSVRGPAASQGEAGAGCGAVQRAGHSGLGLGRVGGGGSVGGGGTLLRMLYRGYTLLLRRAFGLRQF